MPKNIFSHGLRQYNKKFSYTVSFNVSEVLKKVMQYRNVWNEVELQLFEKLRIGPIKREGKDMHGKLKT